MKILRVVKVKDIAIGEGSPKICVPLVGSTIEELLQEAEYIKKLTVDIVEWRVDFFDEVDKLESVMNALTSIRKMIPKLPIVFTFRTAEEGGEREISLQDYVNLNKAVIETGDIDLVDVEVFLEESSVRSLIDFAHLHGVYVIGSNHDFNKTPTKDEIIARLCKAQEVGADLPKIAVMPTRRSDVLTLLDATLTMFEAYADRPIITMSMAGQGVISRLTGEVFGSALTFGAAKKVSAPGQVSVADLKQSLELLHNNLNS